MSAPDRTSLLLEYGARHDVFSAAGLGDVEEVYRHLTEAPHLIGRRDVRFHRTPLDWAVFFGQDAVIDYLLAAGAEPALLWASRLGQPAIVDFLLEQRADPNRRGGWGQMPLAEAADPV